MTAAGKRVPPHDAEAERGVLGIAMLDAEALGLAMDMLSPEVFYLPAHAEIFRHMADMFVSSQVVDQVTVLGRLNDIGRLAAVGGAVYLAGLTNQIPSVSAVAQYCKRLHGLWIVRRLIAHCSEVIEQAYSGVPVDELMDLAEGGMFGLSGEKSAGARKLSELIDESIELLDKRSKADGGVLGVSTGFVDLDVKLAGLEGGNLYILAGRPSMGKTALAMNIVQHAAIQGNVPALVYSMEMSGQQLAERMLSGCANVSHQLMRTGRLCEVDWPKIISAAGKMKGAPVYIDEGSSLSIVDIRARTRRMKSRFGIDLVVIDYLQLMRGSKGKGDREQEVAEISRGLKALAKELNIPVLALCQINRAVESRTDKRPLMSDLRESGSIEQDADVVMFVYRDEYYHPGRNNENMAELIIAKQRSGPVGTVDLVFQKSISTFRSSVANAA